MTLRDIIAALIGAGVGVTMTLTLKMVFFNRTNSDNFSQKNVKAGGDVAGRDIRRE